MDAAEAKSRKGRTPGEGVDRLANAARLSALEKNLKTPIARNRSIGVITNTDPTKQHGSPDHFAGKDEVIVLGKAF